MKHEPQRWKADYDRDGFLVVQDVIDRPQIEALRAAVDRITADPDRFGMPLKQWLDFERDFVAHNRAYNELDSDQVGNALRNIMELPRFDPLFADLICHRPLLEVLKAIFGSNEFSFHNYKCIIKAPKVSSAFLWHRDLPYLYHSTPNLITAMLCLDDMTTENGATVVYPGTHCAVDENVAMSDKQIAEEDLPDSPRVTVQCPAGSAVLFHVNIVHGGGANRSDRPRRNIIGIWAGPDAHPVTSARYAYEGLRPASSDPACQKQLRMTFPHLFTPSAK